MSTPLQRLDAGEVVLLDGATGTELQRRGVPMHEEAWSAAALLTHPEVVQAVHEDHIRAGADVVITNTFATGPALLRRAGMEDRAADLDRIAVERALAAREAAAGGRSVAVAGSINVWHRPADLDEMEAEVEQQAARLAAAGADLIALELMESVAESIHALRGARRCGLPVWLGLSVRRDDAGDLVLLRDAEPLGGAAAALEGCGATALLVMHSPPGLVAPALEILNERWSGPLGAYAHMGSFTRPHWQWTDTLSPGEYADLAARWRDLGARALGGCCGVGPAYVEAMKRRLR